jgi:cyclopropane-fatty-acyl-phospholipid synthase
MTGTYDRIVSIGMMEHLGAEHYDEFFIKIRALLKPDGFAVLHAIGGNRPPSTTGPFLRKYIFPHAYVPSMSEIFATAERQNIWVSDCEIWRLHYYYTIQEWHRRFLENWDKAVALYDERFCRMMEFYLASVMLGFLNGSNMNYQIIVAPKRDAVPIVRDYIVDDERALVKREQAN